MTNDNLNRTTAYGAGIALFAWFAYVVRGGLFSWFDADDLMNLHYYWSRPWAALLNANLMFWSSYYRPGGGLFYRTIYALWGFHPLPFRVAAFILLCLNFGLLAVVVWQLTGSRWCVLVALLILGINPGFSSAYLDTGAIYDVLAYTFVWSAFALYVQARRTGHLPGRGFSAVLFCLFAAALDCKEIAVILPVAVGLYELAWHPPGNWNPANLWHWIRREGRLALIGGLLDIVYVIGKRYGPDSLWIVSAYQPHYSLGAYLESQSHYLRELIHHPITITPWQMAGLLGMMVVLAAITRRAYLLWGVGFVLAGVLPLAFIPGRGGFAYFVPSVGWAVCLSGLLHWMLEKATANRIWLRNGAQVALLALLCLKLVPWQRKWIAMHAKATHEMQGRFRDYQSEILTLIPSPRKGARILLLSDAEGRDDYDIFFLIRLTYGDPKLEVDRNSVWKVRHVNVNLSSYDYLLDWTDGRFVLVSRK